MSPRLQTIAGVIVYGLTLVALVVLLVAGRPVDSVMLLAGPVVAALLVTGQINGRLNPIHATVSKIDEQTNGVLDQRIKTATTDAMRGFLADYGSDLGGCGHDATWPCPTSSRRDRRRMPEQGLDDQF